MVSFYAKVDLSVRVQSRYPRFERVVAQKIRACEFKSCLHRAPAGCHCRDSGASWSESNRATRRCISWMRNFCEWFLSLQLLSVCYMRLLLEYVPFLSEHCAAAGEIQSSYEFGVNIRHRRMIVKSLARYTLLVTLHSTYPILPESSTSGIAAYATLGIIKIGMRKCFCSGIR